MSVFCKKNAFFLIFLLCSFVYLLLSFKNPFGVRSLVSNLEPYPDTLFYSVPAWNLINGNGFKMSVFGIEIRSIVPPIYGLFLTPFFKIFGDVRSFYFANVILGLISIYFFNLITKKLFKDNWYITLGLGLLLITNFYFYNLPSLLMAENISVTVVLIMFYLLISKISIKNTVFLSFFTIVLGLIKFSNVALMPIFFILYFLRLLFSKNSFKNKTIHFLIILFFSIFYLGFIHLSGIIFGQADLDLSVGFSFDYFWKNFLFYKRVLLGEEGSYLWYKKMLVAPVVSWLAVLGLLIGVVERKFRGNSFYILIIILGLVTFMSFFYFPDIRYIQIIFPLLLMEVGIVLDFCFLKLKRKTFLFVIFGLGFIYLFISSQYSDNHEMLAVSLKKQISLNIKYKEDPWNYLAIMEFNKYFDTYDGNKYLATFLPPFYVNYFYNGNYNYLPITKNQEFSGSSRNFVGKLYNGEMQDYFRELLSQEKEVYFSNYYVNNNFGSWNKELEEIKNNFDYKQVDDGCLGSCNIYRLFLKK